MKHLLKSVLTISAAALAAMSLTMCGPKNSKVSDLEHTLLQSSRPWDSLVDIRCDIAMVYGGYSGRNGEFNKHNPNIDGWKERGYKIFWMKGISWGHEDYYFGRWDGQKHLDEYQIVSTGDTVTYHQVPTQNYIEYLKKMLKAVIDDGVDVLFFEEPEFTSRAGYSEAFKRAWKEYYGEEWQPQNSSPANYYKSQKLKYWLNYDAINQCFTYAKEYGKSLGRDIRCMEATHTLINYAQWHVVSPECSLASLPCLDGYVSQTWTGTSREFNYYNGDYRERCFETAYLEFGCMESMTAPTGRRVYFLSDPIEDNIKAAREYGACDTVIPATDTIVQSVDGEVITAIPNRAEYYQGQTPQSFNALRLKGLFRELAEEERSTLTDACKILVLKGEPVALVRGDVSNMKITYTNDMRIARALMEDEGR